MREYGHETARLDAKTVNSLDERGRYHFRLSVTKRFFAGVFLAVSNYQESIMGWSLCMSDTSAIVGDKQHATNTSVLLTRLKMKFVGAMVLKWLSCCFYLTQIRLMSLICAFLKIWNSFPAFPLSRMFEIQVWAQGDPQIALRHLWSFLPIISHFSTWNLQMKSCK